MKTKGIREEDYKNLIKEEKYTDKELKEMIKCYKSAGSSSMVDLLKKALKERQGA